MIILTQPKFSLPGVVLGCLIAFYVFLSTPLAAQGSSSMTEPSPVSGVNFRQITANGLDFRIAVAGDSGPLMLLALGWPESWCNWRHLMDFFSNLVYDLDILLNLLLLSLLLLLLILIVFRDQL